MVFLSMWVFWWSVFSAQTSPGGLAHNKLGEPGDYGTKRQSASAPPPPQCPRRAKATVAEGLGWRLWTPLPTESISNPQMGLKMTLDFPGPKTWAPFGDPSAADTQRGHQRLFEAWTQTQNNGGIRNQSTESTRPSTMVRATADVTLSIVCETTAKILVPSCGP